jgi:YVTN family beta-propeller protein
MRIRRYSAWSLLVVAVLATPLHASFVNYESQHVQPLALSADGTQLFAVNTPDNRLAVFDITDSGLSLAFEIPVGLDPVSVAVESDTRVWVANWMSDTVSIVDLTTRNVVTTLHVGDEPTDIVFAGSNRERAFVCVSQEDAVRVYDTTDLAAPPVAVPIFGSDPQALAVSPDGLSVYVAVFESGNRTTIAGEQDVVAHGGLPEPNPAGRPNTGLILEWDGTEWVDEDGTVYTDTHPYTLPDHDVAVLDATAATPVPSYIDGMDSSTVTRSASMCQSHSSQQTRRSPPMKNHTLAAVDLAKNVFEVALSRHPGCVATRKRLSRKRFASFFAEMQPTTILLEACGSAHHWARHLQHQGHCVVLLPPHAIRPYVPRNKTDRADTKALLEAYRNEDIRPVPIKSVEQQGLAALHRLRSTWVADRTARINTVRGLLREFGLVIPVGARNVVPKVREFLDNSDSPIPPKLRPALTEACNEIEALQQRARTVERQLLEFARQDDVVRHLCSVPGIGVLTGTALVAFIGNVNRFASGRRFASYLGLTPRERSSGQRRRLGSISKRGDVYLRTLLIHGARAALLAARRSKRPDRLQSWAVQVEIRRGHNRATVAMANKMARLAWAVWRQQRDFLSNLKAA